MSDRRVNHHPPLGAHRLLGFGSGAALIRPNGEIDWWCRDRFEAPPVLWSLLDANGATATWRDAQIGDWDHQPAGPTAHSRIRIGDRRALLWDGLIADRDRTAIVRLVRAESGPPFDIVHELTAGGFDSPRQQWTVGSDGAATSSIAVNGADHELLDDGWRLTTRITVTGSWAGFVIADAGSPLLTTSITEWIERLSTAEHDQERFLARVQLPHDHPSRVMDALRVLRVLTDRSTGAPVAAPTTSLPEWPGGDRQYDYRFSWLRDAAYAVATAALLGRPKSAHSYLSFVTDILDRSGDHIPPMTTTRGSPVPHEREVAGVDGWAGSRPVRVGNAAADQIQLDSLATLIEAIHVHVDSGGRLTAPAWDIVDRLACLLASAPFEPTSGIWELREPARLVTDELARWIGLDIAERLRRRHRPWLRRPGWRRVREEAWQRVDGAYDHDRQMFPQSFDGPFVADAATLLAVIHGFYPPSSERARKLVNATIDALEEGPFLRRHRVVDDDPATYEGAFIPTSWWAVTALAAIGDLDGAHRRADEMCVLLPPLLAEEWSVEHNQALGNIPLLWSHTETARSLHTLHRARIRRRYGRIGYAVWRAARRTSVRLHAA